MTKIFLLSLIVLVSLGGLGFWVWQRQVFSKDVLRLEILVLEEVQGGEEMEYTVRWKNNGDTRLEEAELVFEYPEGALPGAGNAKREVRDLGTLYPGQEQSVSFPARLFGKEGDIQKARASVAFRPKELTATYLAETTVSTRISSSSLSFELSIPSRIEQNQKFSFSVNYFSRSSYPLSNLRVYMEYPEGFTFGEATPRPLGDEEWRVGVLNQGDGGRITATGTLQGNVRDIKIFRARIGTWEEGEFTLLAEALKGVELGEPNILLAQTVNGQKEYVASPGERLRYEISFQNAGERNLENLFLVVDLEGRPLDMEDVQAPGATFNPGDSSLTWEAQSIPRLRFLGKGEQGKVEFWVEVKEDWETFSPQDKDFQLSTRVLLSEVEREFFIKVKGKFDIGQEGFFKEGPFSNTGPLPPEVDKLTTSTIHWEATNLYSASRDVRVAAHLPFGVEMTGKVSPQDVSLTFDSASREVVWDIGDMEAGEARTADFQVKFTPSASHKGETPEIVQEVRITGTDTFVEQERMATSEALDTAFLG
ncbi:hypothetical protein KKI17_01665, partial [Patescibacteria group bacterium]|nr:hypothetical protein [Patescibacteria group bacterium]